MALTLTIEDGTGVANANSYCDAAFVTNYAESVENKVWANNKSRQVVALINATRYIDMKYRAKLPGTIRQSTQNLMWPRSEYVDQYGNTIPAGTIPTALKNAVAQAALHYLEGGLDLNAEVGNRVKSSSVSVGGGAVSESVSYWEPKDEKAYPLVDGFMATLMGVARGGMNVAIVRG
jgi:hypothetical protein